MKTHLHNYFFVFLVVLLLTGCASPPATPDPISKPTLTPRPMGTFSGCTYYKGELVKGEIALVNVQDESVIKIIVDSTGCGTKQVLPGTYKVYGMYWKEECATTGAGCSSDDVQVEIKVNETIEMDFEVKELG